MSEVKNTPEEFVTELGEIMPLSKIYSQLAVNEDTNFDDTEQTMLLISYIELAFGMEFRKINTHEFLNDADKLNAALAHYIRFCCNENENRNFTDKGILFVTFCDYFSMEYHECFKRLSEKLKESIKKAYIVMIGINEYKKKERRLYPQKPKTIFDL